MPFCSACSPSILVDLTRNMPKTHTEGVELHTQEPGLVYLGITLKDVLNAESEVVCSHCTKHYCIKHFNYQICFSAVKMLSDFLIKLTLVYFCLYL